MTQTGEPARRGNGDDAMAVSGVPHFQNDLGVPAIDVGARELMCIGAAPPFDHPHVFIDMGADDEAICSYCGTLYRFRAALTAGESDPAACLWRDESAAAL